MSLLGAVFIVKIRPGRQITPLSILQRHECDVARNSITSCSSLLAAVRLADCLRQCAANSPQPPNPCATDLTVCPLSIILNALCLKSSSYLRFVPPVPLLLIIIYILSNTRVRQSGPSHGANVETRQVNGFQCGFRCIHKECPHSFFDTHLLRYIPCHRCSLDPGYALTRAVSKCHTALKVAQDVNYCNIWV